MTDEKLGCDIAGNAHVGPIHTGKGWSRDPRYLADRCEACGLNVRRRLRMRATPEQLDALQRVLPSESKR